MPRSRNGYGLLEGNDFSLSMWYEPTVRTLFPENTNRSPNSRALIRTKRGYPTGLIIDSKLPREPLAAAINSMPDATRRPVSFAHYYHSTGSLMGDASKEPEQNYFDSAFEQDFLPIRQIKPSLKM